MGHVLIDEGRAIEHKEIGAARGKSRAHGGNLRDEPDGMLASQNVNNPAARLVVGREQ